ncbi:MAG: molecular chaperone DnaJ [Polyangiaceae bacterium]
MTGGETCGVCGGDRTIYNSFGGSAKTCPACHGTGRKVEDTGFRDVTKTKPSHYRGSNVAANKVEKATWPTTPEGVKLANEVQAATLSSDTKAKLVREIIDHEAAHGTCTQTFMKKLRRQLRPPS